MWKAISDSFLRSFRRDQRQPNQPAQPERASLPFHLTSHPFLGFVCLPFHPSLPFLFLSLTHPHTPFKYTALLPLNSLHLPLPLPLPFSPPPSPLPPIHLPLSPQFHLRLPSTLYISTISFTYHSLILPSIMRSFEQSFSDPVLTLPAQHPHQVSAVSLLRRM